MLTLYKSNGSTETIRCDDYYVRELPTGLDELEFEVSVWDSIYPEIIEESRIKEQSNVTTANYYIVKAIDAGTETAKIKCQVDARELKADMYVHTGFTNTANGTTFLEMVQAAIDLMQIHTWTVVDAMVGTYKTYVDAVSFEGVTPIDFINGLLEYFPGCGIRIDAINRRVTAICVPLIISGVPYVMREVNLREINYKGKSTEFATRLYPYGKNDLSISSVNAGVPYIDDNTYSSEIVSAYWRDDNYTDPTSLKTDAIVRLREMSQPQRCYEADVVDLAAAQPDTYPFLTFSLLQPAMLYDETRGLRARLTVAERYIYPHHPELNKVIFSTSAQRIQSQVARLRQRNTKV